jgi:hypothetical protein
MSTIGQPRGASREWTRVGHAVATTAVEVRAAAVAAGSRALGNLRTNRPLQVAIVSGIAAWIVLELLFVAWVHLSLEGASHRAFLPGTLFGVPDREAAAGMQCVSKFGYDGQLYYWQSNDIFGRRDAYKHSDNVMYRYQRIGMPMLAGAVATVLGFELTPPLLYHTLNFGFAAIGFGALVYWLLINGLHPAYALGWLLAVGTLESLWKGLLDSSADAVFVLAMMALMSKRLRLYAPLAIFLLLIREVYAIFAFPVFLVTIFGRIDWQDVKGYRNRAVLAALPGVVMLAWTAYLKLNFRLPILEARNNPAATGYPFYDMVNCLRAFYAAQNWNELRLTLVPAFTLVLVSALLVRDCRRLPLAILCAVPFVAMSTCLGRAIWEGYGGCARVTGSVLIVGLMMMPYDKSILLRFMLALQCIVGVAWQGQIRFLHPALHSPHLLHEEGLPDANPPGSPENPLLNDLRCTVQWMEPESVCRRKYHGIWDPLHREIKPVKVAVTNDSETIWRGGRGKYPIWIGCMVYDRPGGPPIAQHLAIIDKDIAPGETQEFAAYIELRRPQDYEIVFSLFQAGPGWFCEADRSFGGRYKITVE